MNEEAALLIIKYIDEYIGRPRYSFPVRQFEELTYSRWAAGEILQMILDHPYTQPADLIEQFIIKMAYYRARSKDGLRKKMFTIAEETACDIYAEFFAS